MRQIIQREDGKQIHQNSKNRHKKDVVRSLVDFRCKELIVIKIFENIINIP